MKKVLKCLAENSRLKKELDVLSGLYDDKRAQVKRYINNVARLENEIEELKEERLRLEGKLLHQKAVSAFLSRENATLILKLGGGFPQVKKLNVEDVKTGT